MSEVEHDQFWTQVEDEFGGWKWYPIDHFFYATYHWKDGVGIIRTDPIAWLESSGNYHHVISGKDLNGISKREKFDSIAKALRRMADIIEDHERKQVGDSNA